MKTLKHVYSRKHVYSMKQVYSGKQLYSSKTSVLHGNSVIQETHVFLETRYCGSDLLKKSPLQETHALFVINESHVRQVNIWMLETFIEQMNPREHSCSLRNYLHALLETYAKSAKNKFIPGNTHVL